MFQMRYHCLTESRVGDIRHVELPAGLGYQRADGPVMDMGNAGIQMMLDLKVKSTQEPGSQPASHREIGGAFPGGIDGAHRNGLVLEGDGGRADPLG